uniref:Cation channel sperm-associated protein 1 n=1 Tax=Monodelphis domestica TaxID=13616 RepID=A0A5F8GRG6_MONDO
MNFLSVPEKSPEPKEATTEKIQVKGSSSTVGKSSFGKHLSVGARTSHTSYGTGSLKSRGSKGSKTSGSMEGDWEQEQEKKSKHKSKMQRGQKKHMTIGDLLKKFCSEIHKICVRIQDMLLVLIKSNYFESFIFIVVCLNTLLLVIQTFAEVEIWGEWYFAVLDSVFLCIYFMEAVLKILVFGLGYFHKWNNLDFAIVIMALLDFVLKQIYFSSAKRLSESKTIFRVLKIFKSFRSLRAIRVLWKLKFLTSLKGVAETLARSASSITAILVLMFTCLFFFSVMLRALFHEEDPKHFGNIFITIFTLFTMLTLDDWSMTFLDKRTTNSWYIIPILMIYIVIQYLIFLNLVIAVLVDNFQIVLRNKQERAKEQKVARMHEKLLDESLTHLDKEVEEQKSDISLQMDIIEKKYGHFTPKQKETMFHYLQLMAAVEHHQQMFRSQAAIIDEIIDTVFEAGENPFNTLRLQQNE